MWADRALFAIAVGLVPFGCHMVAGVDRVEYDQCANSGGCDTDTTPPNVAGASMEGLAGAGGAAPLVRQDTAEASSASPSCATSDDCPKASGGVSYACLGGACVGAASVDLESLLRLGGDPMTLLERKVCKLESRLECYPGEGECVDAMVEQTRAYSDSGCLKEQSAVLACLALLSDLEFECGGDDGQPVPVLRGGVCASEESALAACLEAG